MPPITRRGFLLVAGVSVPAVFSYAQDAADDPVLKALVDELEIGRAHV